MQDTAKWNASLGGKTRIAKIQTGYSIFLDLCLNDSLETFPYLLKSFRLIQHLWHWTGTITLCFLWRGPEQHTHTHKHFFSFLFPWCPYWGQLAFLWLTHVCLESTDRCCLPTCPLILLLNRALVQPHSSIWYNANTYTCKQGEKNRKDKLNKTKCQPPALKNEARGAKNCSSPEWPLDTDFDSNLIDS